MFRVIDAPVFLGLLIVGTITGFVVAGSRGRQGFKQFGNAAIGVVGSLLGGLVYDLSGCKDFFTMEWPPLTEVLIFSIIGASMTSLILVIVRRRKQRY